MRAFKKTLDFINSCSLEELTKELVKYGVVFEENMALKNNVPDSIYEDANVNFRNFYRQANLLRYHNMAVNPGELYSPTFYQTELGENTFPETFPIEGAA